MTELEKALAFNRETRDAVRTLWEELNRGQQQKLMNSQRVRPLLERCGITM